MNVLLDALQIQNRSGTGRYTEALLDMLPQVSDGLSLTSVVPESYMSERDVANVSGAMMAHRSRGPLSGARFRNRGIAKVARKENADIVHFPATVGRQRSWGTGVKSKVVLTVHDLSFLREPGWFKRDRALYYRKTIKRSVRYADHLIADSEATAADLVAMLDVDPELISVTPLGVDSRFVPASQEEIDRVKAVYGLPSQFFLYVGTLEPRKNLIRVIQAFDAIAEQTDFDLVLAGREGWKVGPILNAARKSPYSSRIHFPGFVADEDLVPLLSSGSVFVWPSLWEGFGLPPLEAMACGVPVLTSNTSSLPEVVGTAALTVDPLEGDAIADGMLRLASDASFRELFMHKGIHRAKQFTWKRTAEMTVVAYRRALGEI